MKRIFFLFLALTLPAFFLFSADDKAKMEQQRLRAKAWEGIHRIGPRGSGILALQDSSSLQKGSLFSGGSLLKKPLPEGEKLASSINVFLINHKQELILIDSGWGGKKGRLAEKLSLLEVKPEKIGHILLTHIHPDHIGGLLKEDGVTPFYPKATLYLSQKEYDWNIRKAAPLYKPFARIRKAYKGKIQCLKDGEKIRNAFTALDAPGHTPGHMVYRYKDILFIGDLLHAASLQFADPAISAAYDMDKKMAVATRKKFFTMAREHNLKTAGAHIPFPGVGTLTGTGETFTFLEAE